MNTVLEFSLRHNGACLFIVVLLEQTGLPIPAAPCLLAAGALCAAGDSNLGMVMPLTLLACLIPDLLWFYIGRRSGKSMLRFLCRVGLCGGRGLEQVEREFSRHGERVLAVAKFIPGLSVLAPPLAGAVGIGLRAFLLFDTLGSVLYAGVYLLLGCVFSEQLQVALDFMQRLGFWATLLLVGVIAGSVIYRHRPRRGLPFRTANNQLEPIA